MDNLAKKYLALFVSILSGLLAVILIFRFLKQQHGLLPLLNDTWYAGVILIGLIFIFSFSLYKLLNKPTSKNSHDTHMLIFTLGIFLIVTSLPISILLHFVDFIGPGGYPIISFDSLGRILMIIMPVIGILLVVKVRPGR